MTPEEITRRFEKEIFPIFLAKNYTADTIVGQFDENGNLLPSVEEERRKVQSQITEYLSVSLRALLLHVGESLPKEHGPDPMNTNTIEIERAAIRKFAIDDCRCVIEKMIESI